MLAADLNLLKSAVRQAGAIALKFHRNNPENHHKPDGTVVTEADLAVDAFLKQTIMQAHPEDGWLSGDTARRCDFKHA